MFPFLVCIQPGSWLTPGKKAWSLVGSFTLPTLRPHSSWLGSIFSTRPIRPGSSSKETSLTWVCVCVFFSFLIHAIANSKYFFKIQFQKNERDLVKSSNQCSIVFWPAAFKIYWLLSPVFLWGSGEILFLEMDVSVGIWIIYMCVGVSFFAKLYKTQLHPGELLLFSLSAAPRINSWGIVSVVCSLTLCGEK